MLFVDDFMLEARKQKGKMIKALSLTKQSGCFIRYEQIFKRNSNFIS